MEKSPQVDGTLASHTNQVLAINVGRDEDNLIVKVLKVVTWEDMLQGPGNGTRGLNVLPDGRVLISIRTAIPLKEE